MRELVSNMEYVMLMMTITGFYYVVGGIQYWGVDYLEKVMKVSPQTASLYFAFVSLTSPVLGVVFGGLLISHYGGYTTRRSRELLIILCWVCILFAIPIPIVNDLFIWSVCVYGLLFVGGALLPSLTGLMLVTVPEYQRPSANSLAQFCYNLFGWMPAPFIYGLVSSLTETNKMVKDNIP